jgi:hypothetical protein
MATEIQILDALANSFSTLKTYDSLNDKCQVLLDAVRKVGWGRASLSFLNSKYETKKTLYSGYPEDQIKIAEENKLAPNKRKELLSSIIERWRIGSFYYVPWRDMKARTIVSGGKMTNIPIDHQDQWNPMDLLYAPIYYQSRPIAVITLDEPKDQMPPDKVKLRIPLIIVSILREIIFGYIHHEYFSYSEDIKKAIIEKGTIGIIEVAQDGKMIDINLAGEQLLKLRKKNVLNLFFLKHFDPRFLKAIQPKFDEALQSLKPTSIRTNFYYSDDTYKELVVGFYPQHILYEYFGMICTFNYPESMDLYKQYVNVLNRMRELSTTVSGDYNEVLTNIITLLCQQFNFKYPRIYKLTNDQSTLECILTFDKDILDREFFNHPYNRNSLPATAIIDDEIIVTTKKQPIIRDIRRIWERLNTQGAIAIPLHVSQTVKAALVCDFLESDFEMDLSKEITFKFFAMVLSMALKPYFK